MIRIDLADRTPPSRQIRSAVLAALASGELRPGDRLPTVRQLAGDLGVAPGTVQRAYSELEEDGAVESRGRRGTFARRPERPAEAAPSLEEAVRRIVEEADRAGVGAAAAIAAVADAFSRRSVG